MPPARDTADTPATPLWVFAYGSLMWNPGFACSERVIARLDGHARSFCMRSVHHRGTPERPGLVLALDRVPGASCTGLALRVRAGEEAATLQALRARELVSYAYREEILPLSLSDGRRLRAIGYVVDRAHPQYAPGPTLEEQARIIARAHGGRGSNRAYLEATHRRLDELGIADRDIAWLAARVAEIAGDSQPPRHGPDRPDRPVAQ